MLSVGGITSKHTNHWAKWNLLVKNETLLIIKINLSTKYIKNLNDTSQFGLCWISVRLQKPWTSLLFGFLNGPSFKTMTKTSKVKIFFLLIIKIINNQKEKKKEKKKIIGRNLSYRVYLDSVYFAERWKLKTL